MQTLTNFIQSWLNDSAKPLVDLYQYLRKSLPLIIFRNTFTSLDLDYYCQVLRLQILFEQVNTKNE